MTLEPIRPLVLVVDDDHDTRDMYALFLNFSGMGVLTASSVEAAFVLALEHQPDVVVTDLQLEGAANGVQLCRRLHNDERTMHIPVVLMTGSSSKHDTEAALGAGCAQVRLKPYLPESMVSDVRQIVARPRNERLAG